MAAFTEEAIVMEKPVLDKERYSFLLMQTILRRINEKQAVDPIWLELVQPLTANSKPRILQVLEQQQTWWTFTLSIHVDTQRAKAEEMIFTPLTAAMLFGRYDVFSLCFETLRHRERRLLTQTYRPGNKYDRSNRALTLWTCLEHTAILEPLWKQLKRYGNRTEVLTLVATQMSRLLTLLHGLSKFRTLRQFLMDRAALMLARHPGTFSVFFEMCAVQVTRYLQLPPHPGLLQDGEILSELKTHQIYLPPMPRTLNHWIAHWSSAKIQTLSDEPLGTALLQRIYTQFIEQSQHVEIQRWARSHLNSLLAFMDHRIRPYMTALLPRLQNMRHPAVPLQQNYAFKVHRSQCSYTLLDERYCLVQFRQHQFIVLRRDYETYAGTHWLLLLRGAVTTPQTHPWIRQHLEKYHGHIPRLRFGLYRSDGVVFRWSDVQQFCPELTQSDTTDFTAALHLKKTRSSRSRVVPLKPPPFASVCVLTEACLQQLATIFARWSTQQRQLFYYMFWNIDVNTLQEYEKLPPALQRNWRSMLNDALDWTNVHDLSELRRWLDHADYSLNQNVKLAGFWKRWKDWVPHLSLPVRALQTLQGSHSPLLVLTRLVSTERVLPMAQKTFLGTICCLSHQVQSIWMPLTAPPQAVITKEAVHNLLRMLVAPFFPVELRRVVWHSLHNFPIYDVGKLQVGHPYFPLNTYPVLAEAETAALPRMFIQLQNTEHVPEHLVTVLFSRADGLSVIDSQLGGVFDHVKAFPLSMARNIELAFVHEQGRGPSVNLEVLLCLWDTALKDGIVRIVDEDRTVCLSERVPTDAQFRRLFELGFVSSLCLAKGFYLPYPLHSGLWRYLAKSSFRSTTMCQFFTELAEPRLEMIQRMTPEVRKATFTDLTDRDPDSMTDEELVDTCFLPQELSLQAFLTGWNAWMRHIDLGLVFIHLNNMFCETQRLQVTAAKLAQLLWVQHDNDALFVRALTSLTPEQLQRLVHFITGKTRLPVLELGEERIRVVWQENTATTSSLPRAQNCTHTLLMPPLASPVTPEKILNTLQPLFEFDTVYGFL